MLPRKAALALEAVLDVAYNARPDPVQSRDITQRQGIPSRHLEPVLRRLVREGVLKGVRGPRGGYMLARDRRRLTLGDVLRAVDATEADEAAGLWRAEFGRTVIAPVWDGVRSDALARLDRVSLEDLCREAGARGIPRPGAIRADLPS